jgi:hypothetical protein
MMQAVHTPGTSPRVMDGHRGVILPVVGYVPHGRQVARRAGSSPVSQGRDISPRLPLQGGHAPQAGPGHPHGQRRTV